LIVLAAALLFALLPVPQLTGPVVDQAGVLSPRDKARLDDLARRALAAENGTGPQLAFLIVPSLEGEPIEDYSIRVAEAWKLGTAEKDNGLLFVVSTGDRQMRIEVGGGLEGEITDVQSAQIIRQILVPAFRANAYGEGLLAAAGTALSLTGVDIGQVQRAPQEGERRGIPFVALLFFAIFFISRVLGGRGRGAFWLGAGLGSLGGGRYRGGGGGFGGGGFGGGGGGFSGGGASGNW
jgi:uncharacterized protein